MKNNSNKIKLIIIIGGIILLLGIIAGIIVSSISKSNNSENVAKNQVDNINKIENVKRLKTFNLIYSDSNNNTFTENVADDHWNSMLETLLSGKVYYSIKSNIRTII